MRLLFSRCLPAKIWPTFDCIPFQSASTCCWPETHTQTQKETRLAQMKNMYRHFATDPYAWHLIYMPISKQLGYVPIPTPFCGSQKTTRACLWSRANYSSLKRGEKLYLCCQLLEKHKGLCGLKKGVGWAGWGLRGRSLSGWLHLCERKRGKKKATSSSRGREGTTWHRLCDFMRQLMSAISFYQILHSCFLRTAAIKLKIKPNVLQNHQGLLWPLLAHLLYLKDRGKNKLETRPLCCFDITCNWEASVPVIQGKISS